MDASKVLSVLCANLYQQKTESHNSWLPVSQDKDIWPVVEVQV
jgi:hypothetical protein